MPNMTMPGPMMMVFMFVSMALVPAVIAAGGMWLVRTLSDSRQPGASSAAEAPELRYARGEIDRDEYLQRQSDLEQHA